MASRTAVSALPWHHSTPRAGLAMAAVAAGATLCLGASAFTFLYSGIRIRRHLSSTLFHGADDEDEVLPARLLLFLALEHELIDTGVLCAERNRGDADADALGASRARRNIKQSASSCAAAEQGRKIWLALTTSIFGDGGSSGRGRPKEKSLAGAGAVAQRMEKSSGSSSMSSSMKEEERGLPRRSKDGGAWARVSHP